MEFTEAFIWMTAFAYAMASILPIQFDRTQGLRRQKFFYVVLALILGGLPAYITPWLDLYYLIMGTIYVGIGMWCYGGKQYWGSDNHNLFMCVWDFTLAICFFTKVGAL